MAFPKKTFAAICLLLCALPFAVSALIPGAAHFEAGSETVISTTTVTPQGATLETGNKGTPADGISIDIPPGAVSHDTTVTLSYNSGKITLNSGEPSDAFFRIDAGGLDHFQKPLTIRVHYDPARWKNHVLVGFAIDAQGRLAAAQGLSQDSEAGTASFMTLVPFLFTWVYAPL